MMLRMSRATGTISSATLLRKEYGISEVEGQVIGTAMGFAGFSGTKFWTILAERTGMTRRAFWTKPVFSVKLVVQQGEPRR